MIALIIKESDGEPRPDRDGFPRIACFDGACAGGVRYGGWRPHGWSADSGGPGADRNPEPFDYGDDIVRSIGPCGGPARTADGKIDKTPHGEVFAGFGTHGYREGGGVACMPLGEHSAAAIAVDVGRMNGRGWRR